MLMSRLFRPIVQQVRNRSNEVQTLKPYWQTQSREEFERAWPKLAAKQKHHIKMLKEHHIPVHRSGGRINDLQNQVFYGATIAMLLFNLFQFRKLIMK